VTTDAVLDRGRTVDPGFGVLCPAGPVSAAPTARRTARLLIVDGEAIVRFGLRQLFASDPGLTVVGEAATPRDALVFAGRCPPDLVLLDLDLGRGDAAGVELARTLMRRVRGLRVLVFTACRDRDLMLQAVRLGVHGYLRKGAETGDILRAVHSLLRGEGVFDSRSGPSVVDILREREPATRAPAAGALTERENQVLRLVATGLSNREIGRRLMISEATVKFHVRNLRDKLEVRRRTEIVYTAMRRGMV
jgi:DNA-binding NarL/FixJ family response regulator